jgi:glycosyltransferase involved in cell wall biosynthesis
MMLERITPLILTRDEEANIARTLAALAWAREVIVVDSMSSDRTVELSRQFTNVRVVQREFDDLASQWSFAASQVTTEWTLTLDADYLVPPAFVDEIAALDPPVDISGYEASFVYTIDGRPLRGALYTPRVVLLRRARFSFFMDGHTQRVQVDGRVERLRQRLVHDDRKSLARFIDRQRTYMRNEARKIRETKWRDLPLAGRIRKLRFVAPFAVAVQTLLFRGGLLDGPAGLRYAFERVLAELILSRELLRR